MNISSRFAYLKHWNSSVAATVGTGVAVGVTLGQVESLNNACKKSAKNVADATVNLVKETGETTMNIGR